MSLYNYYLPSVDGLNNLTIGATGYTGISGSATNTGATGYRFNRGARIRM